MGSPGGENHPHRDGEWLRAVLSGVSDAVIVTDAGGRVTLMSRAAEELTRVASSEGVGRALDEVFPLIDESTRAPVASAADTVRATGEASRVAHPVLLVARDGTEVPIEHSGCPVPGSAGEGPGVAVVFRDISEPRRLAIAARRLAAIIESSDDAIVSKDLNGVVATWNAGAERIFGYTAAEMIGQPIARLVPPERDDEEPRILERIRRGDRVDHYETVRVRKDGTRIDVSVTISPVKDPYGRIVGASKVARDVTREKALRSELEQRVMDLRETDRRKDEFLAMLAHELRNPLGAITNAVHVMEIANDDALRERSVSVLRRQVQHQARIVNELLDVSRITRGLVELHFGELDVVKLVREAALDYRGSFEQQSLALTLDLPEESFWVRADQTRLAQVMSNLLSNSAKFTPPGGEVTVAVAAIEDASRVEIAVTDTGTGIEADLLPHVFESFSHGDRSLARSRGGLGLGLAIVKGLVDLHGGEVTVASEGEGRGTAVHIRLPVLRSTARAPSEHPQPVSMGGLRILIIEDQPDAADMLKALLEVHGHEVLVAYTGTDGVRVAREQHPDVVLCDLGLPGMDGFEVAAALRTAPGGAPQRLVAVTGYGQEQDRRRSREAGFHHHLVKPIDMGELEEVLSAAGGRR